MPPGIHQPGQQTLNVKMLCDREVRLSLLAPEQGFFNLDKGWRERKSWFQISSCGSPEKPVEEDISALSQPARGGGGFINSYDIRLSRLLSYSLCDC